MKIGMNNFNAGQGQSLLNVHRINQSIAKSSGKEVNGAKEGHGRRDRVSLSPQNKATSMLDALAQQKESIKEQKNKLIASTLEGGGSLDSIKNQLKSYEEQIKNIDLQMTAAMTQTQEEKTEKTKENENREPKTKEEIQNKRLNDVTSLSADLEEVKTMSSMQSKIEGEARVLESEISLTTQPGMIEIKTEKLAELEGRAMEISSKMGEKLTESAEKAVDKAIEKVAEEKPYGDKAEKSEEDEADKSDSGKTEIM